jgi:hypothetical protein
MSYYEEEYLLTRMECQFLRALNDRAGYRDAIRRAWHARRNLRVSDPNEYA